MSIITTNKNIRIELKSNDKISIDETTKRITEAVKSARTKTSDPIALDESNTNISVSYDNVDSNKAADVSFEGWRYKTFIDILNPTPIEVEAFLQVELPGGMDIDVIL